MDYLRLVDRLLADGRLDGAQAPSPAPEPATPELQRGRCGDCGARLPAGVVIALCRACRRARNPDAADMPPPLPPYPLHIIVDDLGELPGPFALNPWSSVTDPARYIAADLASLQQVVDAYQWCWHLRDEVEAAGALGERVETLIERLGECGVRVRVVALS